MVICSRAGIKFVLMFKVCSFDSEREREKTSKMSAERNSMHSKYILMARSLQLILPVKTKKLDKK